MNINYHIAPTRYKRFLRTFGDKPVKLLDVGTAADSVSLAKRWLPHCRYFGLDITDAHLTQTERAKMEMLILADLETDDLGRLEDRFFDVIVMSHVLEHLAGGIQALEKLSEKLAPGGFIYVEFPSVRSLNLPEARHTLNFSDDPTHIRVYDIKDVANALMARGLRIVRAGRRREWLRIVLSAATIPRQLWCYAKEGRLHGIGLWDVMGFADFVYARRPEAAAARS
jgi:SAM-dependent methyltransferase